VKIKVPHIDILLVASMSYTVVLWCVCMCALFFMLTVLWTLSSPPFLCTAWLQALALGLAKENKPLLVLGK